MSDQVKLVRHFSVNACLAPVASLHGMAVTTIEGIGSTRYAFYHLSTDSFPLHIKFNNTVTKYQFLLHILGRNFIPYKNRLQNHTDHNAAFVHQEL